MEDGRQRCTLNFDGAFGFSSQDSVFYDAGSSPFIEVSQGVINRRLACSGCIRPPVTSGVIDQVISTG
jgi:hypothetical protein